MVRYKPYELGALQDLIPALNQGMDPNTAYSIFSQTQQGAVERAAQQRAARQLLMQQAMESLQGAAQAGTGEQGLEALLGSFQGAFPSLNRPKIDTRLEGTLESLIPQGMNQSPLYTTTPMTGEQPPLTPSQVTSLSQEPESVMGITEHATALAQSGMDLHSARMQIMTSLRAMGYPESTLTEAYDLIGTVYEGMAPGVGGGELGPGSRAAMLNAPLNRLPKRLRDVSGTARVGIQ